MALNIQLFKGHNRPLRRKIDRQASTKKVFERATALIEQRFFFIYGKQKTVQSKLCFAAAKT